MQNDLIPFITLSGGLIMGIIIGLFLIKPRATLKIEDFKQKAEKNLLKAKKEAEGYKSEAIEKAKKFRIGLREDIARQKENFKRVQNLILSKENQIKDKKEKTKHIKSIIDYENDLINKQKEQSVKTKEEITIKLAKTAESTIDQAKELLIDELKRDLELTKEDRVHKYVEYLEDNKDIIAKNMVTSAIQRYASPTSVEKKSTTVTVQRDEIKGRIVGKNAENILLLEELTETDIIFNDQPNTIIISSFNLVKKHIGRETIMKLMKERNITADKIKAAIKTVEEETERLLIKIGRDTIKELELDDRKFTEKFYKIIGKLHFRTSYGQNILKHSYEVGNFTLMLGDELGLDKKTCKIGGFFHDLGKAIDKEREEPHDVLTKEIMEEYGFSDEEVHAAWTHHDSIPIKTAEAMAVKAADAISAGRPGARQESLEKYLERIRAIEGIANSYKGVEKAFAISAGREVRIVVDPGYLEDSHLKELAEKVAGEIEEDVGYPGKVKVNVIRRTENIDYAK